MTTTTIQLADFRAAWAEHRTEYLRAVERVGQSGWLVLGEEVASFERDLATTWGLRHAVGVANGLDALEIAFRCLGAKRGDRFLTTPLTAFATTLAILRVGGIPEFVDVDDAGLMDLEKARARLTDASQPPVRFLVPVHLFGHALSVLRLEALARETGVVVVEDCAQSIGATSDGRPVGSASLLCATSFYPTKNLGALGDGGAVLSNQDELVRMARSLRDYGQTEKYVHTHLGMNSRLDELQAAVLRSVQLPALAAQTKRRKSLAARYLSEIRHPKVRLPSVPLGSDSVWHLFATIVEGDRASFREFLKERGIATGLHYPVLVTDQKALAEAGVRVAQLFPSAERFAKHEVSLPLHPYISDDDATRVIAACNEWQP